MAERERDVQDEQIADMPEDDVTDMDDEFDDDDDELEDDEEEDEEEA